MSNGNPLATTGTYYNETMSATRKAVATGSGMHEGENLQRKAQEQNYRDEIRAQQMPAQGGPQTQQAPGIMITGPQVMPRFQTILVERFREKLKARGSRGIVGLGRQFKIMDDNGSGSLDPYEFNKAI